MDMALTGAARGHLLQHQSREIEPLAKWYVVHNGTGHDDRVQRILGENNFETYVPMIREMKVLPQRKLSAKQRRSLIPVVKPVLKPLFPRYFFVHFDLRREGWAAVFDRAGLHGVLATADHARRLPAEIDESVITALREEEISGAIPVETRTRQLVYAIGEKVRIKGGPLAEHDGVVDDCPDGPLSSLDESASVRLLVSLFGRQSVVSMSIFDIEKL